ncbi:NPCBM/NEW2 domain-containing protein [Kitasatospora sp. NPDC089913]|uniref:NPCBM/NEW2 domain-containing protein n=1 Tax=Kitasatospora sp. NPDC089913 TaxID=3364080 RepID=UPI00382C9B19
MQPTTPHADGQESGARGETPAERSRRPLGDIAALITAGTGLVGLLFGYLGLPVIANSPTAARPTVTKTVSVPEPAVTVTVTAPPPSVAASLPTGSPSGGPDGTPSPSSKPLLLTTMNPVAKGKYAWLKVGSGTLNSQGFETALVPDGSDSNCSGSAEYNLGRQWATLTLTAGIDDYSANTASRLDILADGESIFTGEVNLGKPKELSLDVKGRLRLSIRFADTVTGCHMGSLVLGNPLLAP